MFKRIIWMGTGMAVGAGGAFWAKHKVEATVEKYLPEQVADRAASQARDLGRTVRRPPPRGARPCVSASRNFEAKSRLEPSLVPERQRRPSLPVGLAWLLEVVAGTDRVVRPRSGASPAPERSDTKEEGA